jgi:hypothetical protein
MGEVKGFPGMTPYPLLFPDAEEGVVGLSLPHKVGKAKAGEYNFVEAYCVDVGCDCRRTVIFVVNDKGKRAAVIEFGFDPDGPLAGPYLDEYAKQPAGAEELLRIFVDLINEYSEWLKGMYRRYKQVRKKVDGHAYRGKPFPKPGMVERVIKPPEDTEDPLASFTNLLRAAVRTPPLKGKRKTPVAKQGSLFTEEELPPDDMAGMVGRYRQRRAGEPFSAHSDRQNDLRHYLLTHDQAGDELAFLLKLLFEQEEDEDHLDAALRVLFDALEILRVDLERKRPDTGPRMERWQAALARHIYIDGVDPHLGTLVTQTLLNARVEILPLLHEANNRRMMAGLGDGPPPDFDPEQALRDLVAEMVAEGADSPFELLDAVLQIMAVGDAEVQVKLCRLMLDIDHPVIREAAALMLFHPQGQVREGVADVLAGANGELLTPVALRRLIVSRNWFPERIRALIDQAIANARWARVECAPLTRRIGMTVYASGVDGAMAQTLQAIIPDGKGFVSCSLMPKIGNGVADAFLAPLPGKREMKSFLAMLQEEAGAIESTADYLDLRVCQALADGAKHGHVPNHWLAAIAERLGCDQWRAVPLDVRAELTKLRAELEKRGGRFVTDRYREDALEASGAWTEDEAFAYSWFEDDVEVDRLISKLQGKQRQPDPYKIIPAIVKEILEPRRAAWLERLVLTTLWLKSVKKPPVPWEQMAHVALAVADTTIPLVNIPLMGTIAAHSFGAYLGRTEG